MSLIILNPGVNFRSLKRLFPIKLSKDHRGSVETLNKKPLEYPFNTVTNSKLKAHHHHFRLRWSKRSPKKCLPESSPLPHEHLDIPCTLDPKRSFAQSVREIDQPPPDYPDHNNVFLRLGREKDDDANWEVRYAVECVDSILRSQSEHYGDAGPQDYPCSLVHHIELAKPSTKPQLSALEHDFRHFYSSLTPFPLGLDSTHAARIRDLIAANTWEDLFSETGDATDNMPARGGAGVNSAAVSKQRDHDHPAPTTPEGGCSDHGHGVGIGVGVGPSKVPPPISLLDPQLLARVATWEIEQLDERASTKPAPREEAVAALSNFDDDFQSGGTCSVEWRRPRFGETIPAERINLPAPESTGITKHSGDGTVSGQSYSGGVARASKASGAINQKLLSKRERDDEDHGEGKKRKKNDRQPQAPSGPSLKEEETFPCPFKVRNRTAAKACSTCFPNLSKLKEHLRRAHFRNLQCPHPPCIWRAGTPFEIKRHQKKHLSCLAPAETTNLEDLQRHKALKLKKLTWDAISEICFSIDYARGRLDGTISSDEVEEEDEENEVGEEDEEDEEDGDSNETDEATDYDDEASGEFGEKSEQRNSATETRTHDSTPNGDFLGVIDENFEVMRRMLTPHIISRLETYPSRGFSIKKEIGYIFKELIRIDEAYFKGFSAPQSDFPSSINGQQISMSASQFSFAESSSQNLNTAYPPLPTSTWASQSPPTGLGAPPMDYKQGDMTSDDLDYSKAAELASDLVPLYLDPPTYFPNENTDDPPPANFDFDFSDFFEF